MKRPQSPPEPDVRHTWFKGKGTETRSEKKNIKEIFFIYIKVNQPFKPLLKSVSIINKKMSKILTSAGASFHTSAATLVKYRYCTFEL